MEKLLTIAKRKCDAAEIFRLKNVTTEIDFEDNTLKQMETHESSGVAVRVIKNGRLGMSSSSKPGMKTVILDSAIASTQFDSPAEFTFPETPARLPKLDIVDPAVAKLSPAALIDAGLDHIEAITKADRNAMAFCGFGKGTSEIHLANTARFEQKYAKTVLGYAFGVKLTKDKNFIFVYETGGGTNLPDDLGALSRKVVEDFILAKRNVTMKSGAYPVIIAPSTLATFVRFILACANGNAIYRKESPWRNSLGRELFDNRVTILDDGTVSGAIGSAPFDDEGVPSQRTPIIENGVLHSFIHNLHTAGALGHKPTGNGLRNVMWLGKSISFPPSPSTSNVIFKAGETPLSEIQSGIKYGLLIREIMGGEFGNPYDGEVRGSILLGYKISRGEIVGRVKNAMLGLNVFDALKNKLAAISRESTWSYHTNLPYVMFEGVSIVTK